MDNNEPGEEKEIWDKYDEEMYEQFIHDNIYDCITDMNNILIEKFQIKYENFIKMLRNQENMIYYPKYNSKYYIKIMNYYSFVEFNLNELNMCYKTYDNYMEIIKEQCFNPETNKYTHDLTDININTFYNFLYNEYRYN